jgi:hypothetical protein
LNGLFGFNGRPEHLELDKPRWSGEWGWGKPLELLRRKLWFAARENVSNVVAWLAEFQVVWVAAASPVALVLDLQSCWDRPAKGLIKNAVR